MDDFKAKVQNIYKDDLLDRLPFAEALYNLITKEQKPILQDNNSLVVALDAAWGTGKTFFLDLFEKTLEKLNETEDNKFTVVRYNAWENDDFDEPLLSILYNLIKEQKEKEEAKTELVKKGAELLETAVVPIILNIIKNKTGFDAHKAFEIAKGVDQVEISCTFDKYEEFLNNKKLLIEAMAKFSKENKVVVLIDELDRCRPTYAIELLEAIKHYLNVENYIFIFAIDAEQLKHSIKTQYGAEMDSSGYLRRFFDYNLNFPLPSMNKFIETQLIQIKMGRRNKDALVNDISRLTKEMKLSCRDMKIILNNFIVIWETILNSQTINYYMMVAYIFLISIKYKVPHMYNLLINGVDNGKAILIEIDYLSKMGEIIETSFNFIRFQANKVLTKKDEFEGNINYLIIKNSEYNALEIIYQFNPNFSSSFKYRYLNDGRDCICYTKLFLIDYSSNQTVGQQLSQQLEMINLDQNQ